jgi:hypothetical protein
MTASDFSTLANLALPFVAPPAAGLDDSALLESQRALAEIRRRVDASAAVIAAEIAHRSRPELGYDGLAPRLGARTAEILIQHTTGITKQDARSLVQVGALMSSPSPWLAPLVQPVAGAQLSVGAADAIRVGLGAADDSVSSQDLAEAARSLLAEAPALTVDRLAARARELRADLDLEHVREREEHLRERRYLHVIPQADGMTRLSGLLDPESAATVVAAFDAATSPRRGGPRFVDAESVERAERILADERSTEQLALDTFVELVRIGTAADDGALLGRSAPAVRILVTQRDLASGTGVGHVEGRSEPVSIDTVRRNACAGGAIPILFDRGQVLDVGRSKRLFTARQRAALAARDGGCRFPGCERPPSWTEAHHITEWSRGGRTDVRDGVLLCKHHHLLIHNNGWRVTRRNDDYFVVPPASVDPIRGPIPAPSKSATMRRLVAAGNHVGG